MGLVKTVMEMKAQDIRQCVDMLLAEPTPDADEAQGMPSGKASGKGKRVRVPRVGEADWAPVDPRRVGGRLQALGGRLA
jgi:hypothetical protein